MDFRILGPVEVLDGERVVTLAGTKQRALLALLALHANETLSSERLIDELWGEEPPATAGKTLQAHVSRLRKALDTGSGTGGELVVTREHGYVLRVHPDSVDCRAFERLVSEGRRELAAEHPERAAAALETALSLWRGAPLAELDHAPLAQIEIARLDELRAAAQEDLIDAMLALGRHNEVVGQLEALIVEHPYRERPRAQLMLALYRGERQAEALQVYQDARRKLVGELGIEPGDRLRELEQAVLRQDPALALPARSGDEAEREPPAPRKAFVGRKAELAQLLAGLEDAFAGRGGVFLLVGEPGIGKSRLAEELTACATSRGARVLVGRCWEAGGTPAYWPWVQSLGAHVHATEPGTLEDELGPEAVDLAQVLPELREIFPGLTDPPILEPESSRLRLFEAVGAFLRRLTRPRPLVLVLDDLHVADEPSLLLLRFIARQVASDRLLVICALRDVDPTMKPPVAAARAELVREPWVSEICLAGFEEAEVAQYVGLWATLADRPRLAHAIHARTEGNPFFVAQLVNLLRAKGSIAADDAWLRVPPGLRAVIHERVGRLSERCQSLLIPAAVMGREFGLSILATLAALSVDELLDALDEAMSERVVEEAPSSPGRLRFGHALIRDALYDQLTPARRLQLHARVVEALEAVQAEDADAYLTELAHHCFAAVPAVSAGKAAGYARRAASRAAAQLAYEEAARLCEMALTLAVEDLERCDVLLALGDARARAGDTQASKEAFLEAFELAELSSSSEHMARAALGYGGRILWDVSRDDDRLLPMLERALAAQPAGDSPLRIRLMCRLAGGPLRDSSFPATRRAALSEAALESARRLGDVETLAFAIHGYILGHHSPAHTPAQLALADELIVTATEVGDKERVFEGREERLDSLIELGQLDAARAELESMTRLAAELRQPSHLWMACEYRAMIALLQGRLAEAENLISEARALGERAQSWNATVSYRLQLYVLRREQGRLEEMRPLIRSSVEEYPTYLIFRCAHAHLCAELEESADARAVFECLVKDSCAAVPVDEEWLVSISWLAETAVALSDVPRAAVLYELLLPYADRVAVTYPEVSAGPAARYLGILAVTQGNLEAARPHFEQAIELGARIGARSWVAHSQDDYGRALLAAGERDRGLELIREAVTAYSELGMDSWAANAAGLEGAASKRFR